MIPDTLFVDVEVDGRRSDVAVVSTVIASVTPHGSDAHAERPAEAIQGRGRALVPGLHDHHAHIGSLTAVQRSTTLHGLATAQPRADGWIRVVGYHDGLVDAPLDRLGLDAIRADVPVRVQHRSGLLWIVNSAAARRLGLPDGHSGRLYRADDWMRTRLPPPEPDDAGIETTGALLAAYGIVAVTDASVTNTEADADRLRRLPQQVLVMNVDGPLKLYLHESDVPELASFATEIRAAHERGSRVAIHAVTRVELAFAVAALREAGVVAGDRIEHAGVCPPALADALADLGVVVVTQPHFPIERAAQYEADVAPEDRPWLYPCALLRDRGVPLAAGTDAPFGHPDPWRVVRAAVDRCGFTVQEALDLFLAPLEDPGGKPRRIRPGRPADLCLLSEPLDVAVGDPNRCRVEATWRAGRRIGVGGM